MRRRLSTWAALGAVALPVGMALVVAPSTRRTLRAESAHGPIAKVNAQGPSPAATAPPPPTLAGLDTTKIVTKGETVTAALEDKKVARLTVDAALQNVARDVMAAHHLPEAAVVLMDVATGRLLVYASHIEKGPARDLCIEATAPAASVFKIVTGAALVETANMLPDRRECYSGGEQRIHEQDLVRDPKRDRWCTTLAGAMGRSINTIFARLALENLKRDALDETARALGFGAPLPFDVPVQASAIALPEEPLGYARTAAGFWNTKLSPLHAAWLSATVARGGEPVRPVLVADVLDDAGKVLWSAPTALVQKRALKTETALALTTMMESTTTDGTSYRAFRDAEGRPFLPGISVAGKTGTLTDAGAQRFYTWFTGFAPSRPYPSGGAQPDSGAKDGDKPPLPRQVAIGVLVVNQASWTIKANVLAREVLRAYFAAQHVPSVTAPRVRQPSTTPGTKQRRHRGS